MTDQNLRRLTRLRDAAMRLDDIFGRPDDAALELLVAEHRKAMVEYWDAVDGLKPADETGKPPTQYLRPRPVGMQAKARKPETS